MQDAILVERTSLDQSLNAVLSSGRAIFSFAIIALGVETIYCANFRDHSLGDQYSTIPVIPWLPSIPWLVYMFGAVVALCGLGLMTTRYRRTAGTALGALLLVCTLVLDVPRNVEKIQDVALRTLVFEPLSLACLAVLLTGSANPVWLSRMARYLLALSLIVFGVDHFLVLAGIATLLPNWIPWHGFWVAFFGVAFLVGGISIALNVLRKWGAAGLGLMFAIWVLTLHLPRVLGLYGIPGAPTSPDEWSSLLIALALWGGMWAVAVVESA